MNNIENILSRRKASASLGPAPDGLPWRLTIDRGPSAADLLSPIAARLGYASPDAYVETAFGQIATQLNNLFDQRDVQSIETELGRVDCYVTNRPIAMIVGSTLLASFRPRSPRTSPTPMFPAAAMADTRVPATSQNFDAAPAPPVRADVGTGRLAIPLDGTQPLVVNRIDKAGAAPALRFVRRFESESLAALKTARFSCEIPQTGDRIEGGMSDVKTYEKARRDLHRSRNYYGLTCSVDRSEVAERLADLADRLHHLHQSGEIHGDVKPTNILITGGGVTLIDSLDMTTGMKSPAMTPGWAAPEQIIGDDVQFATDQYALGLLLCNLVQGVVYGEEATFIVPVGGNATERFILFRNPGVYLPPELTPVDTSLIGRWQRLLMRCLRFNQADRFATMSDLAAELRDIVGRKPLRGQLEMFPWFGTLTETAGTEELSWEVQDIWA